MKKLELKNLKVKKLTAEEKITVNGGMKQGSARSEDMCCNYTSTFPVRCSSLIWDCSQ